MSRILVIGGHGFIGSWFCRFLEKEVGIDDYDIFDIGIYTGRPSDRVVSERIYGLPRSIIRIPDDLDKYEYIFHFGSFAGIRTDRTKEDYFSNNVDRLVEILPNIMKSKSKLIYISSSSVLSNSISSYAESKNEAERKIVDMFGTSAFSNKAVIIRPFTVYGHLGRPDMLITRIIDYKLGIGSKEPLIINGDPKKCLRRFTFVGDLVKGIWECRNMGGASINMCSDEELSVQDILKLAGLKKDKDYIIAHKDIRDFDKIEVVPGPIYSCKTLVSDYFKLIFKGTCNAEKKASKK